MNKFRKHIAFVLALAMAMSLSVVAFAVEDPSTDVTGSYGSSSGTPVYSYTYQFGDMEFKYNGPASGTWNPKTHQYEGEATEGGWVPVGSSNEITVWNHSNGELIVTPIFEPTLEGAHFGFSKTEIRLATAVGTAVDAAPSETFTCNAFNDCVALSAGQTNVKLGTVTLKVRGA